MSDKAHCPMTRPARPWHLTALILAVAVSNGCGNEPPAPRAKHAAASPTPRAAQSGQARRRKSPYSSLPQTKLADSLSKLGMTELMSELMKSGDPGGAGGVRIIAARALISAAKAAKDPAERDAKLDEAIALLKAAIKVQEVDIAAADSPTKTAQATIRKMQTQLLMTVTQALTRGEPYANKLLFLQGAEADRKALAAATEGACKIGRDLAADIEDLKLDWRRDMRTWIAVSRKISVLEAEAKYRLAWIRFYHGMATRDTKAGRADLRAVEPLVEPFIDGSRGAAVQQQSELLLARAHRELGLHDAAEKMLAKVISGGGSASVRMDAQFERVRNLIEHGRTLAEAGKNGHEKYNAVPAALKRFDAATKTLAADDQSKRMIDLWGTLLEHYLYETLAKTAKGKATAAACDMKAQDSLLGFLHKYPDEAVQNAFYDIITRKYRDRQDYDTLGSAVLMAIASHEFNAVRDGKGNTEALARAKKILLQVYSRTDRISKRLRPMVLWQLAFIMNFERDNFKSARFFAKLATEFPDHRLAYKAATYAKDTIHYLYTHVDRKADNLREKYRDILLVYTGGKWGDKPEVRPWNFQLAEQLAYFAEKTERLAVKNAKGPKGIGNTAETCLRIALTYEKVPDRPHMARMQARSRALRWRWKALRLGPKGNRKAAVGVLVQRLLAYSNDAGGSLKRHTDKQEIADLTDWGAEADYRAAMLLLWDVPGGEKQAKRIIDAMHAKWPGAAVLQKIPAHGAGKVDD